MYNIRQIAILDEDKKIIEILSIGVNVNLSKEDADVYVNNQIEEAMNNMNINGNPHELPQDWDVFKGTNLADYNDYGKLINQDNTVIIIDTDEGVVCTE